jgi:hypothetical protein
MLLILNLLFCGYSIIKTISVFKNVNQPFKINNIRYRESINPIFALESSNKWATISENNIANYQGNVIYGNNQLKDILIQTTWTKIDYAYIFNDSPNIYHILASTKINTNHNIDYKIMDNNNILWNTRNLNLNHFNYYLLESGFHNISIWAKANNPVCLCCSKNKGFTNSYQLAIWKEDTDKQIDIYNNSVDLDVLNYNLISNETNEELIDFPVINYKNIINTIEQLYIL